MSSTVWTVGHSTRTGDEFRGVLAAHGIELLIDVRRFPGSRRLPQFESSELARNLEQAGVLYLWLPSLGGRRRADPESMNAGWRNAAFRGYADHLSSEEFAEGLFELLMLSQGLRAAIMCAEVLWWRCHRRLIADVLLTLGLDVVHIRDRDHSEPHRLGSPARVVQGLLTYAEPT